MDLCLFSGLMEAHFYAPTLRESVAALLSKKLAITAVIRGLLSPQSFFFTETKIRPVRYWVVTPSVPRRSNLTFALARYFLSNSGSDSW